MLRFNGARFIWNREAPADLGRTRAEKDASMGPGSFGTGKARRRPDASGRVKSFNGARFIWNREGSDFEVERAGAHAAVASMGPGSFGTGKKTCWGGSQRSDDG
mgnify:FL=1